MSSPNNFTDGTLVGIVVGGDVNDKPPDQSCNMKIFIPGLHGKDVDVEHLAFSTMQKSPSKSSQSTFEGTLDPGSVVFVRKDTGSNQCHIIGTGNEIYDPDSRIPGNTDLLNIPQVQEAINRTINVRIPPNTKETTVNGVKVRKVEEKGELHRHALLKGIPGNGAIYTLSGAIVPQVKGVSTASQSNANILTPALAALVPGSSISLGSLLGSLATGTLIGGLAGNIAGDLAEGLVGAVAGDFAGSVAGTIAGVAIGGAAAAVSTKMLLDMRKKMLSKMSPQTKMSFQSMSLLTQGIETGVGGGFTSGNKVDPVSFLVNAVDLFSQCGNLDDLVYCMRRMQYDTSLHGLDNIKPTTFLMSTPFGIPMPMSLDASGRIVSNLPKPLQLAIDVLGNSMASPTGFPGINPGQNLFGKSSKNMFDMYGRLPGPKQAGAIALAKKLNQSATAQRFDRAAKTTVKGGNPFNSMF